MDQNTVQRYQPGGDLYAKLVSQYGQASADAIAQAAATGDRTALANAIENARGIAANSGSTSTWSNFWSQITTDPLAAPLSGANNLIGNSFLSLLKNPWVIAVIVIVLFFALGGPAFLRAAYKK